MEKEIEKPPELKLPNREEILKKLKELGMETPIGCKKNENDNPLPIRYVTGKDWFSLVFNLISFILFWSLMVYLGNLLKSQNTIITALPWIIVFITFVFTFGRLYTNTDAQKAKVFIDLIFRDKLIVYPQGFHFTTWCSKEEKESEVDFQKHETETDKDSTKATFTFPSSDGFRMVAPTTLMYKRREGEEAMSWSLKFKKGEIGTLIRAIVAQALSELGGLNSYETLLYYKAHVTKWLANLFGGQEMTSKFERETGTSILDPVLNDLDLTPEDQKVRQAKAKARTLAQTMKMIKEANKGMEPEEIAIMARIAQGENTKEQISTNRYHGIPPGVTTFAPGGGVAVSNK